MPFARRAKQPEDVDFKKEHAKQSGMDKSRLEAELRALQGSVASSNAFNKWYRQRKVERFYMDHPEMKK